MKVLLDYSSEKRVISLGIHRIATGGVTNAIYLSIEVTNLYSGVILTNKGLHFQIDSPINPTKIHFTFHFSLIKTRNQYHPQLCNTHSPYQSFILPEIMLNHSVSRNEVNNDDAKGKVRKKQHVFALN